MASNKLFSFGPVALTNTLTTDILSPPLFVGGVGGGASGEFIVLNHIRITNKTSGAATFSLWYGLSGANTAGTEIIGSGYSVAPNSSMDWYGSMRVDINRAIVGGASANTTLTIEGGGEIGVQG